MVQLLILQNIHPKFPKNSLILYISYNSILFPTKKKQYKIHTLTIPKSTNTPNQRKKISFQKIVKLCR